MSSDLLKKIEFGNPGIKGSNVIQKVVEEIVCSCNVELDVEQKYDWYY